jgi:hypothetical protein
MGLMQHVSHKINPLAFSYGNALVVTRLTMAGAWQRVWQQTDLFLLNSMLIPAANHVRQDVRVYSWN